MPTGFVTAKIPEEVDKPFCLAFLHKVGLIGQVGTSSLIYANTERQVVDLITTLSAEGLDVRMLHGGLSLSMFKKNLKDFREGKCPILVLTDVLDGALVSPNVSLVVLYDLPRREQELGNRIKQIGTKDGDVFCYIDIENESDRRLTPALVERMGHRQAPDWLLHMAERQRQFLDNQIENPPQATSTPTKNHRSDTRFGTVHRYDEFDWFEDDNMFRKPFNPPKIEKPKASPGSGSAELALKNPEQGFS
ncbi:unnamed protein product [Caenorhabditis sp. 36 PRJEB53466]|nr:unnamed protein product [Caenorhabditis sp. 36 PRJEB53466]